jgi:hypothetical protein
MTRSGVYCVGLSWFVPIKAPENKNGQRSLDSLTGGFEAFHEQNAGFARSISWRSSAGIGRGRPRRPSSPIRSIVCLYHPRSPAFKPRDPDPENG